MAMTNEELARRIQQGERDLLLQLWEQVRRYACDRAYKWHRATGGRGGVTLDDLEQEAFLALLAALEGWDEKAGKFLTWYDLRLRAAFTAATAQRTQRDRRDPLENCLSLDAPLTDQEGDSFTLEDTIPDPRAEAEMDSLAGREMQQAVRQVLDRIPENQRQVLVLRYFHGLTVDRAAERLHLSRSRVSAIEHKALRVLRQPVNSRELREYR